MGVIFNTCGIFTHALYKLYLWKLNQIVSGVPKKKHKVVTKLIQSVESFQNNKHNTMLLSYNSYQH